MFQALQKLLAVCASLTFSLVANGNGTITVTVMPKANKGGGENNAALNTPLSLTGTAEELDAGFLDILAQYTGSHKSLSEQLEATEAILDAAKKEAATKATKTVKKAAAGNADTPSSDPEEEEEAGTGEAKVTGSESATQAQATAAAPQPAEKSADNLWGE